MDESTDAVTCHQTQQPENNQDDGNGIQHIRGLVRSFLNVIARLLNIATCTADGIAAGSEKSQGCTGNEIRKKTFDDSFHIDSLLVSIIATTKNSPRSDRDHGVKPYCMSSFIFSPTQARSHRGNDEPCATVLSQIHL